MVSTSTTVVLDKEKANVTTDIAALLIIGTCAAYLSIGLIIGFVCRF